MRDLEKFWIVIAVDREKIEDLLKQLINDELSVDLPITIIGTFENDREAVHANMAIDYPQLELIHMVKLFDMIGELTS